MNLKECRCGAGPSKDITTIGKTAYFECGSTCSKVKYMYRWNLSEKCLERSKANKDKEVETEGLKCPVINIFTKKETSNVQQTL